MKAEERNGRLYPCPSFLGVPKVVAGYSDGEVVEGGFSPD